MKTSLWLVSAALWLPALPLAAQSAPSRVIECGTDSRQRVLCAAGGEVTTARMVRDLSSNRCSAAGSWGWAGNVVWTDNSCRGQFEVSYRGGAGADTAATRRITCGTLSSRRAQCSTMGVADSVRLVQQSMFARCTEGTNWGYSDSLLWAGNGCRAEFEVVYRRAAVTPLPAPAAKPVTRTLTCGQTSGELHTCTTEGPVDTVRLVRDLTGTPCRQKFNWDYARGFVWARSGCRGVFEVTYQDTLAAAPTPGTGTRRITCGSYSGTQVTCKTEGSAADVRLVQDFTGTRCREGTNWGHTDSFIWTNKGCRGEFEVTYVGTPATSGTRRLTCGSASAVQVRCVTGGEAARVRVVRNLGSTPCREGDNWKHSGTAIMAGRGCRAEFEVTFGRDTTEQMKPVTPATRVISCGNASGSAMSCNAFGMVATIRVARDRSGGRCGQASSWGLNDQSIWVARGCYGDFELTYATDALK